MKLLEGKTAVITGAGRGIGYAIAKTYAKHGANVVVLDLRFKDADAIKKELGAFGTQIRLKECDVTNTASVKEIIDETLAEFNEIDIWVNNAGIVDNSKIDEITPESWEKVIAINMTAVFFCSQLIFEVMKKQNHGKIVNMASLGGERGGRGSSCAYSASKAGVIVMTKCFALNGGEYNINVNNICPGLMLTEMTVGSNIGWLHKDNNIPLVRFGTPEDVAGAALFYASSLSDYVTGDTVDVNGGIFMR